MSPAREISPALDGAGVKVAVVATRFNEEIVDGLVEGALERLRHHGVSEEDLTLVRVPGALELAPTARLLARSGAYDGIVALGCVIRGETAHFEHVSRETTAGLARVALEEGIPLGTGVLTVEDEEQARVRAGLAPDVGGPKRETDRHRGREAAVACLEMVAMVRALGDGTG